MRYWAHGRSPSKRQPYWCGACRKGFSVRTGTALERSRVPLRKWAIAIYREMVSLKGVSSMRLHRGPEGNVEDGMVHVASHLRGLDNRGRVAILRTGGGRRGLHRERRKNMPKAKRKALTGRDAVGKAIVAGAKDRATNRVGHRRDRQADAANLRRRARGPSDPIDRMASIVAGMVGKRLMYRDLIAR